MDYSAEHTRSLFRDVDFIRHAPNTPNNVEELIDRIRKARLDGVAVVDEEYEVALIGIAVPVRNCRGRIVAALNVSAPKFRLGQQLHIASREISAGAAQLSSDLGAGSSIAPVTTDQSHAPGPNRYGCDAAS